MADDEWTYVTKETIRDFWRKKWKELESLSDLDSDEVVEDRCAKAMQEFDDLINARLVEKNIAVSGA